MKRQFTWEPANADPGQEWHVYIQDLHDQLVAEGWQWSPFYPEHREDDRVLVLSLRHMDDKPIVPWGGEFPTEWKVVLGMHY